MTRNIKCADGIHLLFFKPAGFASKRAFTKVPTFSLKLSSGKLSCKMIVITIIVRFPTHNWLSEKKNAVKTIIPSPVPHVQLQFYLS